MNSSFTQMFGITRSGLQSNMLDLDSSANNLANINTTGYKASRMDFQEMLFQNQLSGTRIVANQMDMQSGAFKATENPLNIAISGEGFFKVNLSNGQSAYTRNGDFQQDENQKIVDGNGNFLAWEGNIPEGAQRITVSKNGEIHYELDGVPAIAGNINIYRFINPSGLEQIGDSLFIESPSSGTVEAGKPGENRFGQTVGSTLEASNVNMSREFTHIIATQRSFQVTIKALQQADQMMAQAIQMRKG